MQLLSIGLMEPIEGFEDKLRRELALLKKEGLKVLLKSRHSGQKECHYICYIDDEVLIREDFHDVHYIFYHCIANALADFVIKHWEPALIRKIIRDNYFFLNGSEQDRIYEFTEDILNYDENLNMPSADYRARRKSFVLHKILDYVRSHSTIIIDGFVRFRLGEYLEQLEETVDKATDEYFLDREYREFLNLLRHFVGFQESKLQTANLIIGDGEFYLFDGNSSIIDKDPSMGPDFDADDLLVSTLINLAPKHIIIHGKIEKDRQDTIDAILKIFEGRVSFCNHCKLCMKLVPFKTK